MACLVSAAGVGKSCLLQRFAEDSFQTRYIQSPGIDFKIRTFKMDGNWVNKAKAVPDNLYKKIGIDNIDAPRRL